MNGEHPNTPAPPTTERRVMPPSRPRIELTDSLMDVMIKISQGNPGALSVLMKLMEDKERGFFYMLDLDDMGMRGSQIWVAWKDHCKEDLPIFLKALQDRDEAMVNTVNASKGHSDGTPRAVRYGGSR